MDEKVTKTQQTIIDAASNVFIEKGYKGSTMQEIADKADINKALLHYYYRSKEKLFQTIFSRILKRVIPRIGEIITSDIPLKEKIEAFVEYYIDIFLKNPYIPSFIIQELGSNPQNMANYIKNSGVDPDLFLSKIKEDLVKEGIPDMDPRQFLVNLLALCIFPFAARPIIQTVMFKNNKEEYTQFIIDRKKELPKFIYNSILRK